MGGEVDGPSSDRAREIDEPLRIFYFNDVFHFHYSSMCLLRITC